MECITLKEAKENNLKWYFTGRPCKNGHVVKRQVSNRQCYACSKIKHKKWQQDNLEHITNYSKNYDANRYQEQKEQIKKRVSLYYKDNKDKIQKYNQSSKRKATVAAQAKFRRKTDIQFRLKNVLRCRLRDALKRKSKKGSAVELLGVSVLEATRIIESKFVYDDRFGQMSWDNYGSLWHIDHIKPLAKFDLTDQKQLAEACHISNLQPLWAIDNKKKSDKFL